MATLLTVPAGTVASDLSGFPVRVDLADMPAGWWSDVVTHGSGAIRVKQGATTLPRDLVRIDTGTATGELFFRADLLAASDNDFSVEVEPGGAAPAATDPTGRNAVWADFDAVYVGGYTNRQGDATRDAFLVDGSVSVDADGWINFGESAGGLRADNIPRRTTWTMGVTANQTGDYTATDNVTLLTYTDEASTFNSDRATLSRHQSTSEPRPALWDDSNGWIYGAAIGHHSASHPVCREHAVYASTTHRKHYVDGALGATDATITQKPGGSGDCSLYIGIDDGTETDATRMHGRLNYIYLRNGELSADWVAAEYESWESPATFYSVVGAPPSGVFAAELPGFTSELTGAVEQPLLEGVFAAEVPGFTSDLGASSGTAVAGVFAAELPGFGSTLEGYFDFAPFEQPLFSGGIALESYNTVAYPTPPADPDAVPVGRTAVSVPE